VRIAVIDVGSNTLRLLVAAPSSAGLSAVHEERAILGLGEDVERHGVIPDEKVERAARLARSYVRLARKRGVQRLETVVTAPGRQSANAEDLLGALASATGADVRVLSTDEEGELAFLGAIACTPNLPESVAVCDVGGGSTEVVVGTLTGGPAWSRSYDTGSLRLTTRFLEDDPPGEREVEAARAEVARVFERLAPPLPQAALATGGSARALRKLVGRSLGAEELETAVRRTTKRRSTAIAKRHSIEPSRARTLLAGALILGEVEHRLAVPFRVARGGLREGLALGLLSEERAA